MKDFDKIKQSRGNIEEVLQGKFLTRLSNVDKCLMIYVFFTKEQETEIRNYVKENTQKYPGMNFAKMLIAKMDLTPSSMKISVFKHLIEDMPKFESNMEEAHNILMDFKTTKSIKSSLFNANDLALLKELTNQDTSPF